MDLYGCRPGFEAAADLRLATEACIKNSCRQDNSHRLMLRRSFCGATSVVNVIFAAQMAEILSHFKICVTWQANFRRLLFFLMLRRFPLIFRRILALEMLILRGLKATT
jgi:hypothetical protein